MSSYYLQLEKEQITPMIQIAMTQYLGNTRFHFTYKEQALHRRISFPPFLSLKVSIEDLLTSLTG